MIEQHINIEKYNWEVTVLYNVNIKNIDYIFEKLGHICKSKTVFDKVYNNFKDNKFNNGFIYSNPKLQKSLIIIGKTTSKSEFINTIVHEANHLESHIATVYDLDEKGEEVSYLIGYIVQQMYGAFKKLIC